MSKPHVDDRKTRVCPKTGRPFGPKFKGGWALWLFPLTGLSALVWFLVRVIPKPSRATYPCQKVAFPLASSFVAWILGLGGSAVLFRKARERIRESRRLVAALFVVMGLGAAFIGLANQPAPTADAWTFSKDPLGANNPVGTAKGIFPGRVVWVHDPDATDASKTPGYWFDKYMTDRWWWDSHNNQAVIDDMFDRGVRWLTGEATAADAWDAMFHFSNLMQGKGDVGYTSDEMIAIKGNFNEQRSHTDDENSCDLTPHVVLGLLKQLVNEAGVPQDKIVVFDTSRYIANKVFDKCHALFPDVIYMETNYYGSDSPGTLGREMAVQDTTHGDAVIYYKGGNTAGITHRISTRHRDADYFINLAIWKKHQDGGFTNMGKNTFGCLCRAPDDLHIDLPNPGHGGGTPVTLYAHHRPQVCQMGHPHIGGKALLYLTDGLWGGWHSGGVPKSAPDVLNIPPFDDIEGQKDYPSSLFFSLDAVALDSVLFDFIRCEEDAYKALYNKPRGSVGDGYIKEAADDYLHEAAQAGSPPSGSLYDPDNDGTPLASLGTHEHWNDVNNKQYTRNLGTGNGVELYTGPGPNTPPTVSITSPVNGAVVAEGSDLPITATAADTDGTVESVEFFYDGTHSLGTDNAAPWQVTWNDVPRPTCPVTTYVLTAVATDDDSASTTSDPVTITVAVAGDADLDGDVDATDLATLGLNWSPSPSGKTWLEGDFDNDGDVDATDLAALGLNWNPSGCSAPSGVGALAGGSGDMPVLVDATPAPGSATPGLKAIALVFDRSVEVGAGAVEVYGRATGEAAGATVSYDDATRTLTVSWPAALAADTYEVRVLSDAVLGADGGAKLDGEVADPADASSLPSGDGTPGGDARLEFIAR